MSENHSDLVIVYNAPHMVAANMVNGILKNNGIPSVIKSRQIPMYNDIALMHNSVWGLILVPKKHAARARKIIEKYLQSIDQE